MADKRPLHEVLASELARLCELYAIDAKIAGAGGVTDKLIGLGAEIEALCTVLDNGVVPAKHIAAVILRLRAVEGERLSRDEVRDRHAATRVSKLITNLTARGEGVDGLRPLHEVLLRWIEHQMENFVVAVVTHQDDKVFVVGAEIRACASALLQGVVPAEELNGVIGWVTRIESRVPVAKDPTVQAVATALGTLLLNLEARDLFARPGVVEG